MRRPMMLLALLLLAPGPARCAAQEPPALKVDGNVAKEYIAHLSSDAMQGRASGTPAYSQAAEWAAAKFQEWGLQPAGEDGTYFQNVKIRGFEANTGVPTLRVGTRDFYLDDNDFSVESSASSPAVTVTGEIVFVGYGIAAPDKGLNEYAGLDVNGKIVLAFQGSPQNAPQLRRPFEGEAESNPAAGPPATDWTEEAKDVTKIKTAYQQGAAAILLYDPDESADEQGRRRRSTRSEPSETFRPERAIPVLHRHRTRISSHHAARSARVPARPETPDGRGAPRYSEQAIPVRRNRCSSGSEGLRPDAAHRREERQ